jgi:hypothetical protein
MAFDITGLTNGQVTDDVSLQSIILVFEGTKLNVLLLVPALLPFTRH